MKCPDQSHDSEPVPVFAHGETDFRQCNACGLVFREDFPSLTALDDLYQQAYSEERIEGADTDQESGSFASEAYSRYLLTRLLQPGMRVLDYGSGTGELVMLLRQAGVDAEGYESSKAARDYCEKRRGFALSHDVAEFSPESFDMITMIEVIEHVTDLWGTLSALRWMLKPQGMLLVTTPNRKGIRARIEKGFWREARKKYHLFLFDSASIKFHLGANGFAKAEDIRFGPIPRPGFKFWLFARFTQILSMSGSLCVVARRD